MPGSRVPFARRVYTGRGALIDEIVTEVAERPELVRLIWHARDLSEEELETLIGLVSRSFDHARNGNGNGHRGPR
ncbi:MAG TPA: hypothetical protein VET65_01545 [Candidatus Limnocylindrales bacterium]|nr:hypothetical protein [Candidatus Limnocylindrales bacterium]